jgi:hypothetical protein
MIVIEGLKGKPVAEIGTAHQMSHSQYDQWRDPLLAHASQACEIQQQHQRAAPVARENTRVKALVGELTWERKTSDEVLG